MKEDAWQSNRLEISRMGADNQIKCTNWRAFVMNAGRRDFTKKLKQVIRKADQCFDGSIGKREWTERKSENKWH